MEKLIRDIDPEATADSLLARALAGYWRAYEGGPLVQPDPELSGVESHEGLLYVVLRVPDREPLAVYRVTNQGQLKQLKRWPDEIG